MSLKLRSADFHCDVLMKLLEDESRSFTNEERTELDVTLPKLRQGGSVLQTFAIYIPERMEKSMMPILQSIDLFQRKILTSPSLKWIRTRQDVNQLNGSGSIGALLSLEGADGLQGELSMLRILYQLGVRAVGLTWNRANWGADGVLENRQGGLTGKGREFVAECNRLGMLLDVSHLSDKAFWDMVDITNKPLIASHSNARTICDHPRNLTDDQIRALIAMNGRIGVTFVPQFVIAGRTARVDDILLHVEHICTLGGEKHIMFGSDFDGIESHVMGLSNPGELENLQEALLQRYNEALVSGFMAQNALDYLLEQLPAGSKIQ
ncbi:membrane dipeptidase [Paenibacillus phyllosphaerae]|uniref:Membrane dipeptidase n=1 Tax=Paenibacillus phyllosphaerae TaxID=274593 RepID=A0A7W5AWE2_9BACL|nr:dipeptidase [Paenibacillus phyllosphaerae]MBB3109471.1 membrane dipeptidase [Paenibacillus phyllosphaerae]